jgi:hypothetical protein
MKMKKCLILSILALINGCADSSKISTPIDKPVTKEVQAQKTKEKETLYKRILPGGSWAWMKEPPPPDSNEPVITYEMVQAEEMAQAKKYKEEEAKLNEKLKSLLPSRETYGQFYSGIVVNQPASPMQSSALSGTTNLSSDLIESRIDGDFEGWDGDTIFKLINGQIWQQVSYDYTYHYAFMPKVLIFKTTGGYKMKVEGVHKTIYVERLK